uniref:Uncharacterized protein n=1 Tax=Cannabis sativa TaxID=3483 RepID=A0A803P943_CANSA
MLILFLLNPRWWLGQRLNLDSSSSKIAGLLKLPMKPSRSKKNELAPKRKLILNTSSSPLSSPSAGKKKLQAHPPSPSPSSFEFEPKEEESESKTDESYESFPDHVESAPESKESEFEDVVAPVPEVVIVKAFYANLNNEIVDSNSTMFCKVFVRGHWFSFSPQDVAKTLHLPSLAILDEEESEPLDKDEVLSEIVGQKMVGTGHDINLSTVIYDQIISFRKGNKKNLNRPFPQVIYKILSMRKSDLKTKQEDLVAPSTAASYKASAPILDTVEASSSKKSKPQSLVFASDDLPTEAFVPTASASITTKISGVRASLDALTARVLNLEGLQRSVLDVVKALSKVPEA